MPADLDARLLAAMHSLGFFCADGHNHLAINTTPAAAGTAFDNLRPEDVRGATLELKLKQKRKQVGCAASWWEACGADVGQLRMSRPRPAALLGRLATMGNCLHLWPNVPTPGPLPCTLLPAPPQVLQRWSVLEGVPEADGVSFGPHHQVNDDGTEYSGWHLAFTSAAALAELKRWRAACHAAATLMPWDWVEKHQEIDLLLQVEAAAQLPRLQRKAEWLRIERSCRAMRAS